MAGLYICRNPALIEEDKLVESIPTKGSNIPTLFLANFCAQIPAFAQALTPALGLLSRYTNVDLQKATKLALKLFVKGQEHGIANSTFWKKAAKAQNLDFYYSSSHIKCYYFY